MTRPDMSVRYSAARFLERVATGRRTMRVCGGGGMVGLLVGVGGERETGGAHALVRPSLVAWYVPPHFL